MSGAEGRERPSPGSPAPSLDVAGTRPLAVEGAFQALGQGLGEAYLGAFALLLGAGGLTLGLVATLPTAATAAAQVLTGRAVARAGRARALVARAWSTQAVLYASLGLCALLPYPWSVIALCVTAVLGWGAGGLAVPAWTALVSTVVPRARHGWFFGMRGSAQQLGVLAALLGGGALLSWMASRGREVEGFALVFLVAGLARAAGTGLLGRVPEQGGKTTGDRPGIRGLRPPRLSRKVRRLAFYLWTLHLATHVSTPFFVPYMLKDLRFPYVLVGLLIAVPATVKILTLRFWGRVADRVGPGPLLRTAGWLVALVPGLWLLSGSPWWILAAQIFSGIVWGAFELAQASSILQATRGRERDVALFNAVDGGILIAGSLLGGITVNLAEGRWGSGYLAAMGLSSFLRLLPAGGLLWRVRGIGKPPWSHLRIPMRVWAVRPTRGMSLKPLGQLPAEEPPKGSPGRDGG